MFKISKEVLEITAKVFGTFYASSKTHKAKIDAERSFVTKYETNMAVSRSIEETFKSTTCKPLIDDHITETGARQVLKALKKSDHFGAQLAIDANPGKNKNQICIAMLKLAITIICSENSTDLIRSATYVALAYPLKK